MPTKQPNRQGYGGGPKRNEKLWAAVRRLTARGYDMHRIARDLHRTLSTIQYVRMRLAMEQINNEGKKP